MYLTLQRVLVYNLSILKGFRNINFKHLLTCLLFFLTVLFFRKSRTVKSSHLALEWQMTCPLLWAQSCNASSSCAGDRQDCHHDTLAAGTTLQMPWGNSTPTVVNVAKGMTPASWGLTLDPKKSTHDKVSGLELKMTLLTLQILFTQEWNATTTWVDFRDHQT